MALSLTGLVETLSVSARAQPDAVALRAAAADVDAKNGAWERGTIAQRQGGLTFRSSVLTSPTAAFSGVVRYSDLASLESPTHALDTHASRSHNTALALSHRPGVSALEEHDAAPEPEPDEALRLVQLHVQEAAQRHGDHMLYADDDASEADEDDEVDFRVASAAAAAAAQLDAYVPSVSSRGALPPLLDVFDAPLTVVLPKGVNTTTPAVGAAHASQDSYVAVAAALLPSPSYAELPMDFNDGAAPRTDTGARGVKVRDWAERRRPMVTAATMYQTHRVRGTREVKNEDGVGCVDFPIFSPPAAAT